jgi:fatty acid/phospholipid biosynthesis enzyme
LVCSEGIEEIIAGLSIPGIIFKTNLAVAISAPVLPALTHASACPSRTKLIATRIGANVDSPAESLFQFAVMGAEVVKALENISDPKVGLLNIGEEETKGNEQVKAAAQLLDNSELNYIGYVEGFKSQCIYTTVTFYH